jgi:hypothetical protein
VYDKGEFFFAPGGPQPSSSSSVSSVGVVVMVVVGPVRLEEGVGVEVLDREVGDSDPDSSVLLVTSFSLSSSTLYFFL